MDDAVTADSPDEDAAEQPQSDLYAPAGKTWTLFDVIIIGLGVLAGGLYAVIVTQSTTEYLATLPSWRPVFFSPLLATLIVTSVSLLVSTCLLGMLRRGMRWAEIGLRRVEWWWLAVAGGASILLLPVRLVIGLLVLLLVDPSLEILTATDGAVIPQTSTAGLLVTAFLGSLIVPFAEELFFRGVLFKWLRQHTGVWASALISAAIFGLGHLFLPAMVSAFVLGVVMAVAYEYSQSLWVPIFIHVVNNAVVFSFFCIAVFLSRLLELPLY
jgi:membrane protease YdiL (CAAX protease family)